jgi:hypothetical protein
MNLALTLHFVTATPHGGGCLDVAVGDVDIHCWKANTKRFMNVYL